MCGQSMQGQRNNPSQRQMGPSLSETEKWLQQTLSEPQIGEVPCDNSSSTDPCLHVRYEVRFNGCRIRLTATYSSGLTALAESSKNASNAVVSFDFADIDPTTVKQDETLTGYSVNVRFSTTDDGDKIRVEYPNDPDSKGKPELRHDCCGMLDDGIAVSPTYAPRLVKALTRAVRLCGGKSSAF